MAFYEHQFPTDISQGSRGGPNWSTVITPSHSGKEKRIQKWETPRHEYDVIYGVKSKTQLLNVLTLLNEMRGMAHGFRYKDPLDYEVTDEPLVPNGSDTVQLIKTYSNGLNPYQRIIKKPVSSPAVTMEHNSSPFTGFTIDPTTGIATLTALSSFAISGISQGNPGTVTTSSAHGFSNGDEIYIKSVVGMTEVNDTVFTISGVTATTFSIGVDTTSYTAYTSGGSAEKHVQSTDSLTWTGEFDVPVRFDVDGLDIELQQDDWGGTSIPIVELKET